MCDLYLPDLITLASGGIIYRAHVLAQDGVEGFFGVAGAVQFLAGPDGMQVVAPALFVQFVDARFFLNLLIEEILVV